jgi:hypothetical protein
MKVANKPLLPSSSAVSSKPARVSPRKFSIVPLVNPASAERLAVPF